jgi:hypothetical protein
MLQIMKQAHMSQRVRLMGMVGHMMSNGLNAQIQKVVDHRLRSIGSRMTFIRMRMSIRKAIMCPNMHMPLSIILKRMRRAKPPLMKVIIRIILMTGPTE